MRSRQVWYIQDTGPVEYGEYIGSVGSSAGIHRSIFGLWVGKTNM